MPRQPSECSRRGERERERVKGWKGLVVSIINSMGISKSKLTWRYLVSGIVINDFAPLLDTYTFRRQYLPFLLVVENSGMLIR